MENRNEGDAGVRARWCQHPRSESRERGICRMLVEVNTMPRSLEATGHLETAAVGGEQRPWAGLAQPARCVRKGSRVLCSLPHPPAPRRSACLRVSVHTAALMPGSRGPVGTETGTGGQ